MYTERWRQKYLGYLCPSLHSNSLCNLDKCLSGCHSVQISCSWTCYNIRWKLLIRSQIYCLELHIYHRNLIKQVVLIKLSDKLYITVFNAPLPLSSTIQLKTIFFLHLIVLFKEIFLECQNNSVKTVNNKGKQMKGSKNSFVLFFGKNLDQVIMVLI